MSSGPLELSKLIKKASMRYVKVEPDAVSSPPSGKHWLILYGNIKHVTGTNSQVVIHNIVSGETLWNTYVLSAKGSNYLPMFNTEAVETQAQYQLLVLSSNEKISFFGGTGAQLRLMLMEW